MPWNSPLPLTSLKLAPALAAGNTVVLKPSEFTSASLLEFVKLVEAAGFPPGVVNVVTGYGAEIGDALVSHPRVDRIAFTGGPEAGRMINEKAARHMKRVTMELGGKSPNIVFDDADLDEAVKGVVAGIFAASGQTCVAGSRLLVQSSIHDEFVAKLVAFIKDVRFGHPSDPATQIAPISTRPQLEKIKRVRRDRARPRARALVAGGRAASVPGWPNGLFFEPTIFADVDNRMRIAQEEVFGPVLSVIRFEDEDDAVRIANDIQFGLAAGVWTQSMRARPDDGRPHPRRHDLGEQLPHDQHDVAVRRLQDERHGREGGIAGMREYLEVKSVWMSTGVEFPNPFVRQIDMKRTPIVPPSMQRVVAERGYLPALDVGGFVFVAGQVGRDARHAHRHRSEGAVRNLLREPAHGAGGGRLHVRRHRRHHDVPRRHAGALCDVSRGEGPAVAARTFPWTAIGVSALADPAFLLEVKATACVPG